MFKLLFFEKQNKKSQLIQVYPCDYYKENMIACPEGFYSMAAVQLDTGKIQFYFIDLKKKNSDSFDRVTVIPFIELTIGPVKNF